MIHLHLSLLIVLCMVTAVRAQTPQTNSETTQEKSDREAQAFAPVQDTLPVAPPKDAIVLFDGEGTNLFLSMDGGQINWPIEDGALVSTRGQARSNHLVSRLHFRDAELHAEFMLPEKTSGNSGLYIHGNYELQIFNSFGKTEPQMGDVGAIYGFSKPLANACRAPGQWQVYDILYRAPRRDENGQIVQDGSITAFLNGVKVQAGTTFGEPKSKYHPYRYGTTPYLQEIWKQQKLTGVGPVFLQDHDSPVRFRNVWVRPLDDQALMYEVKDERVVRSEREWRQTLTAEQYRVLRMKGTERPFVNKYDKHFKPGTYACAACGQKLFSSETKFNSGCGWPAFYAAQAGDRVKLSRDVSLGMVRTEVCCARCDSHLGHIFDDAPQTPTGQRYCINSVSLKFIPAAVENGTKTDE